MKRNMGWMVVVAVIALFFVLLYACIHMWGSDPDDASKLTLSTSFLASSLSLFALIYAILYYRNANAPSEQFYAKYMQENDTERNNMERK